MSVPAGVRSSFAHAVLAQVAREVGADLLHVKGAAIDASLAAPGRAGTDADVMVRPAHGVRLVRALTAGGWVLETSFVAGSPFGHAATLRHPTWGHADVHRLFPGVGLPPAQAFDRLWSDRRRALIAGMECTVPSLTAQSALLVLNAARPGPNGALDLEWAWRSLDAEDQRAVRDLVVELDAEVAFASAVGELERFRSHRSYALWRSTTLGGSRSGEWWARIRAAPSLSEAARLALRAPMVNREHLAVVLGHEPTRWELGAYFLERLRRALDEGVARARRELPAPRTDGRDRARPGGGASGDA